MFSKGEWSGLFWILYLFVGCIIATPYTLLAGGEFRHFLPVVLCAPIVAWFCFFLWLGRKHCPRWEFVCIVSFLSIFLSLPIVMNWLSILLKFGGYGSVGYWVFELRYASIFIVLISLACLRMIATWITQLYSRFRGGKNPPADSPPMCAEQQMKNAPDPVVHEDDPCPFHIVPTHA